MSSALTGQNSPASVGGSSSLAAALQRERDDPSSSSSFQFNQLNHHQHQLNVNKSQRSSFSSGNHALNPSPSLGPSNAHSFRRAKALLDNMARSINSQNSQSFMQSPIFGPGGSTTQLAMSLSRSLGKSWTRDAFLDTLAMHLDPKSPFMAPSPQRDLQQFAMLEDKFCKDFTCCGIPLDSMHDLLQHYEEFHVRVESDYDDDIEFDDDDDEDQHESDSEHFPFGLDSMDEDDMDMDEFDVLSAQQQQEANTAFLRAQIAAMSTNTPTANSVYGFANPQFQPQQPVVRATISSMLGTPGQHPPMNTSSFSQIQKHDNQVDDFRILRSQSEQNPSQSVSSSVAATGFSAFNGTIIHGKHHMSSTFHNSSTNNDYKPTSGVSTPKQSKSSAASPTTPTNGASTPLSKSTHGNTINTAGHRLKRRQTRTFDAAPELLPFCESTPTRVVSYNEDEYYGSEISELDYHDLELPSESCGDGGLDFEEVVMASAAAVASVVVATETTMQQPCIVPTPSATTVEDDRPFKCKIEGCGKEYKNPNRLKYHMRNGHAQDTGDPEVNNMIQRPYGCVVGDCGKRYKNLNGLKVRVWFFYHEIGC
ncbi:UNVERIFIED_CONTAM: Transcriptional regulator of ribosomal biogenesis proteins [Siphonaria sp. JEL0065]|nr:Transcriptional regulator of ribosomal biogenesis proteins [Siphonaria sp. JEL0065]